MIADQSPAGERESLMERLHAATAAMETRALPGSVEPLLSLDLTVQQLKVLTVLVTSNDGGSGRTLSAMFGVTMASMSGMLDRLVARGLAARTMDTADQRIRKVHATALGRKIVQNLVAARPEFNDLILSRLSLAELRALETGIAAISREMTSLHHPG